MPPNMQGWFCKKLLNGPSDAAMRPDKLTIALAHLEPDRGAISANLAARARGRAIGSADLVLFPELLLFRLSARRSGAAPQLRGRLQSCRGKIWPA
jgi:hypothetical protein